MSFIGIELEKYSNTEQRLSERLSSTVESLGYVLWGIEYSSKGRGAVLRIFIDAEAGISVDDCAIVSNQVGAILDVEELINENYELEVSSPGIDRKLFHREQCSEFIGEQLDFRLRTPFKGRRKVLGRLREVLCNEVVVEMENQDYRLPFDILEKVKLQPNG